MSASNFNLSDQNEVQVVYHQDQEHQSYSDDMVNDGGVNAELRLETTRLRFETTRIRLKTTELHQELTRTLVRSARLEERNNQLNRRINEREQCVQISDVALPAVLAAVLLAIIVLLVNH